MKELRRIVRLLPSCCLAWCVALAALSLSLAGATGEGRLTNVSTRAFVGTGDEVLIGGFIVEGGSKRVLVRALGPTLGAEPFNVAGALSDPTITLTDVSGTVIGTNDDWRDGGQVEEIEATGLAPPDDAEPALIVVLAPGAYTPIIAGAGGAIGVGIVEVYELTEPEPEPEVILQVSALETPPVTATLDSQSGICTFTISEWSFLLANVPTSAEAGQSAFNDLSMTTVMIAYDWINPVIATPPRTVGLGGVVVPVNGTNTVAFSPIAFDDLSVASQGSAANLTLTFEAMTLGGDLVSATVFRQLSIEPCQ